MTVCSVIELKRAAKEMQRFPMGSSALTWMPSLSQLHETTQSILSHREGKGIGV